MGIMREEATTAGGAMPAVITWRAGFTALMGLVVAPLILVGLASGPVAAGNWRNCGGGPYMTFMNVQSKGLPCSSAWILGEEALDAWDGFSRSVKVRGFTCKMFSGYPYHAAVGGTCKKGKKAARFATGD